MTWGQLRLQLQTAASAVPPDLLDGYLNSRYGQVLTSCDWSGLRYHGTVQTTAAYQSTTDKVSLTVGSATVTGSGTAWGTNITGLVFYRPGDGATYKAAYVSGTQLTLDRPYEGANGAAPGTVYAGAAYVLMQNVYPLPGDVRAIVKILDPETGLPLAQMSKAELDAAAGTRALVDTPECYAPCGDTAETTLPVYHQVEFYPPPRLARGYPMEYLHAAVGFDGSTTGAAPLPWVSDSVLLYGCQADIAAYLASQAAQQGETGSAAAHERIASMYEEKFHEELGRMLRVEHQQRRGPGRMTMASRFTRHRLARATRGFKTHPWGTD